MAIDDEVSLGDAREWLIEQVEERDHEECPCCGQHVECYHRLLYKKPVEGMLIAYRTAEQEWFHWWRTTNVNGGDHAKLSHWGLMETASRDRNPNEPGVGYWRLTDKGVAFVRNTITVPKCARVTIKNRFVRWCDDKHTGEINIRGALGEEYDYDKMMGR